MSHPAAVEKYRHVIEVVSPEIDMDRLFTLLKAGFGASFIKLRSSIRLAAESPLEPRQPSSLGRRIVELLQDGKPWRVKHVVEATGAKTGTVRNEIESLWEDGFISRVRFGVYMLSGLPEPDLSTLPPLSVRNKPTKSEQKFVYALSEAALSAAELRERFGITRQRVDQVLKSLEQKGFVKSAQRDGLGPILWMSKDSDTRSSLVGRSTDLSRSLNRIMSCLKPDQIYWVSDIVEFLDLVPQTVIRNVEVAVSKGMLFSIRIGKRVCVGITPKGIAHPQRSQGPYVKPADIQRGIGILRIRIVETIGILGEARTRDVTSVLMEEDFRQGIEGRKWMSGQSLQAMEATGLIGPIPGDEDAGQPRYKLTDSGLFLFGLIKAQRAIPSLEETKLKIDAYHERRRQKLREKFEGHQAQNQLSDLQRDIVESLRSGPKFGHELGRMIAAKGANKRSVHLMLRTLAERGFIKILEPAKSLGHSHLWGVVQTPYAANEMP